MRTRDNRKIYGFLTSRPAVTPLFTTDANTALLNSVSGGLFTKLYPKGAGNGRGDKFLNAYPQYALAYIQARSGYAGQAGYSFFSAGVNEYIIEQVISNAGMSRVTIPQPGSGNIERFLLNNQQLIPLYQQHRQKYQPGYQFM